MKGVDTFPGNSLQLSSVCNWDTWFVSKALCGPSYLRTTSTPITTSGYAVGSSTWTSGWVPISGISSNALGIPKSSHKSSRQLFLPAPPHEDFYREVLKIFFHPSVYPWSFRPKIIIKILFLLYFFFSNIASLNICPKFTLLFLITEFILTSCTSSIHFWVQLSWWLKILLKYNLFLHSKTRNEDTSV